MNCQKCGRQLLDTEKFCIACGTPVAAIPQEESKASHAEAMTPPAEPVPPPDVRCDSCGETLTTDDRFCQACGAQVGGPAVTEGPASRLAEPVEAQFEGKGSNSTIYSLLGLAFVLIAVSYFAYDYFSTPGAPNFSSSVDGETELAQRETVSLSDRAPDGSENQVVPNEPAPSATASPSRPIAPTPAPRQSPAANAPSPPGTSAQNTSPGISQEEAAGRLGGYRPPPTSPAAPTSPPSLQQTSPDTSQEEAAGRFGRTTPPAVSRPPPASPSRKASGGEVLMPGGKPARRPAPPRAPTQPVQPPPAKPAPKALPQEGTIFWTGKLQKNQVIVIENGEATVGIADGDHFTGIPIDVYLPSPAVRLVERPTAQNNWKRVAFRCLRTTKQSVTVNIQWDLLR